MPNLLFLDSIQACKLVVAPWCTPIPPLSTFHWPMLNQRLTVISDGCDKGSDGWNLDTGFTACAMSLRGAALCALLFTSSCMQFAERQFNIFPQHERERRRIQIFIFCYQKLIKTQKYAKWKEKDNWFFPASTFKPILAVLGMHIFLQGGCKLNRAAVNPGSPKKIN